MMRKVKVQPIQSVSELPDKFDRAEPLKHPPGRSRFVRLLPSVLLRTSSSDKANEEIQLLRDGSGEFEPSSVCLAKMVQNFMEDSSNNNDEKMRCGRRSCNCFDGVDNNTSGDEPDCFGGCFGDLNHSFALDACEILKTLVPCSSVVERNLLADATRIVQKNNICKQKRAEVCRNFAIDGLVALGYTASICKSRWEKTSSFPAGEYEYIDVVHEGERLLVDIDFRSEFEIARPIQAYKTILQTLPLIFVGKPARLEKIISTVTDAAKQSLKKKGLHFPPWRKAEYVKLKWLAPYTRIAPPPNLTTYPDAPTAPDCKLCSPTTLTDSELPVANEERDPVLPSPEDDKREVMAATSAGVIRMVTEEWNPKPPQSAIKSKTGFKVVTGLASIMKE